MAIARGTSQGSSIKHLTKAEQQLRNLKTDLKKVDGYIDELNTNINKMMTGDGTASYWEGQTGYNWFNSAIKKLNGIIQYYRYSYDEFADYAELTHRAKMKSKGNFNKQTWKLVKDTFNGSIYTGGVKKNKDDKKINAVSATVHIDAANDDQSRAAYQAFCELKNTYRNISSTCTQIANEWQQVAANTKGQMHRDANKRYNATNLRKNQTDMMLNDLDTAFIGDMLFR